MSGAVIRSARLMEQPFYQPWPYRGRCCALEVEDSIRGWDRRMRGKEESTSSRGPSLLKRDGLVAGEKQRGCSWEEAAGEGEAIWASGRGIEAGEKRRLGCPRSSPSGCTCNK